MDAAALPLVPAWVTAGITDPYKQRLAVERALRPVTTAAERAAARRFRLTPSPYHCAGCGQFSFPKPTTCWWCRQGRR